jgi:hypothetical protein
MDDCHRPRISGQLWKIPIEDHKCVCATLKRICSMKTVAWFQIARSNNIQSRDMKLARFSWISLPNATNAEESPANNRMATNGQTETFDRAKSRQ